MSMLTLGIFLIFIGLLVSLYRKIPNKSIFFLFLLILLAAVGFTAHSVYTPHQENIEANQMMRDKIIAQQQVFSVWYAEYQKSIDNLDYNWRQYKLITSEIQNDDINRDTAYNRLSQLEESSIQLRDSIVKLAPPATLNDENYQLSNQIHHKTIEYAEAQLRTITRSKEAVNPYIEESPAPLPVSQPTDKEPLQKNETLSQSATATAANDLTHRLHRIMLTEAPIGLFTAKEISAIRANLYLPEASSADDTSTNSNSTTYKEQN